jgi:hypothetical protein
MTPDYDITLIAGRREDLLRQTLASFSDRVFRHFPIRRMIVNIDPFMGDAAEGDRCEALVRGYFPDATVFRPEVPEFATAVARVWAATTAPRVLHLEDDWIALEDITLDRVESLFGGDVAAVAFLNANKKTRRLRHQTVGRLVTRADGTVEKIDINAFSTSPGVFEGEFLREAARRMQPGLDPEKQFFLETNLHLEAHALPRRCMFLRGSTQFALIEDIGRQARAEAGLVKRYKDGASVWRQAGAEVPAAPEG